jgi:hypothetical protein
MFSPFALSLALFPKGRFQGIVFVVYQVCFVSYLVEATVFSDEVIDFSTKAL